MRKLPLWKKFVFGLTTAVLLLAIAEISLRLIDYQGPAVDPFESFVLHAPLFEAQGVSMRTRPGRRELFHDQGFLRDKPKGLRRIVAVGGSATYGWSLKEPLADSYPNRVAVRLADAHPGTRVEAVNGGGLGYASYRLVGIVEELLDYAPDAVVVMSGNNEFLEPRHYGDLMKSQAAKTFLYDLRLGRLLLGIRESTRSQDAPPTGEEVVLGTEIDERYIVRDDEERRLTLEHYARNLNRMIDLCQEKGVPIVLCTVPTNVRDFAPYRTEPYAGSSVEQVSWRLIQAKKQFEVERYRQCVAACLKEIALEERAAAFHYLAAQALEKLGRNDEAADHFFRAKDYDAFPHRTTSEFNEAVREIAGRRGLPFYDMERAFRDASPNGVPGNNLFVDQCHPNQAGHDLITAGLAAVLGPLLFP